MMKLTDVAFAAWLAIAGVGSAAPAVRAHGPAVAGAAYRSQSSGRRSRQRKVTLKELDAKWEEFDAAEQARVTQLLYQNRRNMLDQVVGEILIENAAKAANQTVDQFRAGRRQAPAAGERGRGRPVLRAEQAARPGPHARRSARADQGLESQRKQQRARSSSKS